MDRRALITGVSSFAGRKLAAELRQSGWSVAGTVGANSSELDHVAETQLDIADEDALVALIAAQKPSVVFHLAAIVDTVETPSTVELYRVNTLGTAAVCAAVRAAAPDARLVFTSSAFVYGSATEAQLPIVEGQMLAPLTPYGSSKSAAEDVVKQFARSGGKATIARAFQHSGDGHVGAYALSDWAEQLAEIAAGRREAVMRVGNLDVFRDYLDVRDVATAYAALGELEGDGEVFNVCSGQPVSMRQLLDGLVAAFGVDVTIEVDQSRLRSVDQPRFFGSPDALKHATGWEPKHSIDEMLAQLAGFWRSRVG